MIKYDQGMKQLRESAVKEVEASEEDGGLLL